MMNADKVKLGIAPIAWTNDDMPELGGENTFEQCISEMALAGFTGCEVGIKYPANPAELKEALDLRGLVVCNQWYSTEFITRPHIAPWGAVNPTPTGITYGIAAFTDGSAPATDGSNDTVVIDADGKITITDAAVVANSGEYTVTATASADSNYLNDSPLTATIAVAITDTTLSLADASFVYTEVKATAGTANDIGADPYWETDAPPAAATYEISASTGANEPGTDGSNDTVVINSGNGKITITDAATTDHSGEYTVTVTAGASSNYTNGSTKTATATVTIKLNLNTVGLSYADVTATEGTANDTGVSPAWDGNPNTAGITYSITDYNGSGEQDAGVVIDPDTGDITITAQALAANNGDYTVTATAGETSNYAEGTTRTATVTVKVRETLNDYSFSYPIAKGENISVSPVWRKGTDDKAPSTGGVTYATNSQLPSGLTLDVNSGVISGTMPSLDTVTAYQITATGDGTDYTDTATGTFLDKFVSADYTPNTTGTAISNIDGLKAMALGGVYYLTAHIDLSTEQSWIPIASISAPFTGTLNGNGYAIYNLTIDAETAAYQGLFASVSGATIKNLSIGVSSIKGKAGVGALAGVAVSNATLTNIGVAPMTAEAKIVAVDDEDIGGRSNHAATVGGLVGYMKESSLTGVYNQVTVEGLVDNEVGGLAGFTNYGTVSGYTTGAVSGVKEVGGLVGYNSDTTISGYATGDVSGTTREIGGLVGRNTGTISGYTTGAVSGGLTSVGGLVGINGGIVSGYATGNVTAMDGSAGGLVGYSYAGSQIGYATGAVSGTTEGGGIVGRRFRSNIKASGYWDKQSTGQDIIGEIWDQGPAPGDGITATKNIVLTAGIYTDSGNGNAVIFDNANFKAVFDTTNGANKTWPKLKSSYTYNGIDYSFDFPQPTVSATNVDGTIEVTY